MNRKVLKEFKKKFFQVFYCISLVIAVVFSLRNPVNGDRKDTQLFATENIFISVADVKLRFAMLFYEFLQQFFFARLLVNWACINIIKQV